MSHHKQCTFPGRNGTRLQHQSVVSPEIMNGSTDYSAFSVLQQQDCRASNLQSPSPPYLYISGRKSSNPNPQFLSSSPPPSLYLGLFPQRIVTDIRDQSSVETRKAAISSIHGTLRETKDKAMLVESLQEIVSLVTPSLNDGNFKIVLTTLQLVDDLVSKTGSAILPFLPMLLSHYLDKVGTHKYMVKQTGMKVLLHLMTVLSPSPVINEIINFGSRHKQGKVREETLNIVIASLLTFPSSEFSLASLVEQVTPLLIDTKQTVREACLEACAVLADRLGREQMHILLTAVLSLQRITTNTNTENLHVAFQSRLSRKKLPLLNEDGLVNHVVNVSNGRAAPGGDRQLTGADVDWILDGKSNSLSANSRSQSTSGPLKSAGKKLPWDNEPTKSTGTTTGGYASLALKQQITASSSLPIGQSSTIGGTVTAANTNKTSKGYSDIYKTTNETGNGDSRSFQPSTVVGPMKHSRVVYTGGSTGNGGGNGPGSKGIPGSSSLSTTWPRQNGSYGNNHFTKASAARQISADNTALSGNLLGPSKLPAIDARPSSKPIVRNPLPFHPQPPPFPSHSPPPPSFPIHPSLSNGIPPDSPTHIEESFLIGGNDDDDYYNIPVDDSQLNNSLSSSLTSLLFNRDMQSATAPGERTPTVDSLSQIRKKAADWKAEILSVQCSASTSPTSTPPRMHKQFMLNGRMEFETVSAPVALKRERPLKDKNTPMEANSLLTSPNKQQQQQQRGGGGEGGKAGGARRTGGGNIPRRESDPSFQSRPSELHKKQTPMKKTPLKMFKTPPRKYNQGRVGEEGEGSPDLPLHDLEANPEFISPPKLKMNPAPPAGRTIKKISPTKAASAPQKSSTSISQANSTSNSAPVYRLGSQEPLVEEESSETDARLQELSPLMHPESALRQALERLRKGTEEWEEKCEALLVLRRLSAWHKPIIIPQLHTVLIAVEKEVKNLRSQVARNAIACLGDMFGYLAKEMEISLDALLKTLLHVGSKSNNFYREDTEKALYLACNSVSISPAKCLQALMNGGLSHGSQLIRRQVAHFMCVTVEFHGAPKIVRLPRDVLDRVIHATAILLGDADPLARYQARKMLNLLSSCGEFDELARKALNDHQYLKIKETSEHIKVKGLGKPPTDSQSAKATARLSVSQYSSAGQSSPGKGQSPPKVKKRRSSISGLPGNGGSGQGLIEPGGVLPPTSAPPPPDSSAVLDIVTKMKATDWKERQEAINELEQYVITHPNSLGSNLVKVFDVFNERLSDKNSKVNLHALQAFQRLVPILNQQLSPVLPTLVEALSGTVASRYPAIHSAALNAIDSLMQTVDCTLLFPPLASAAQNGNARVQPIMLKKLSDLIPYVYDQKPGLVQRIGLPVLWKVLSSRSPATGEAKQAILRLTEVLHLCLGPNLQESASQLSPTQQQKLQELVQTLHLQNR